MPRFTEPAVEETALEWFETLGYYFERLSRTSQPTLWWHDVGPSKQAMRSMTTCFW